MTPDVNVSSSASMFATAPTSAAAALAIEPRPLPLAPSKDATMGPLDINQKWQGEIASAAGMAGTSRTDMKKPVRESQVRKQRNREHAKRSREKKKNELETLQAEMEALQDENEALRTLVKKELPSEAAAIISQACYRGADLPVHLKMAESQQQQQQSQRAVFGASDFELLESLTKEQQSFVLTDPRLPDNPIVYASRAFTDLTGYQRDQVIGRNCRFLQGPGTDEKALATIREGIEAGRDVTVRILNFKADGTPFWNQFFLAALHDKDRRVVNYVGVQCLDEEDKNEGDTATAKVEHGKSQQQLQKHPQGQPVPSGQLPPSAVSASQTATLSDPLSIEDDEGGNDVDWAVLAKVLEADFNDDMCKDSSLEDAHNCENDDLLLGPYNDDFGDDETDGNDSDNLKAIWNYDEHGPESLQVNDTDAVQIQALPTTIKGHEFPAVRTFVLKTLKSELIYALLDSQGNVSDERFSKALYLLSEMYRSQQELSHRNDSLSPLLHGVWRSISRPNYSGCLGQNENGESVYTLGKMSFNMFQPGNLRCTVQRTSTSIAPVCEMDKAPRSAPFGLRRELALHQIPETNQAYPHTILKSYDISVAVTIEPSRFKAEEGEEIPAPPRRLCGVQEVQGYFLPDPSTPNRLTVWFTGGKLSPAPLPASSSNSEEFGDLEDWKRLFSGNHKRTWGESLSVMGAKVFLGAELPKGMDESGTFSYTLHRPQGGHGKGYVDVSAIYGIYSL